MAKHAKHKRPMPARNDMQSWEGYDAQAVKPGMHRMPDGKMMSEEEMKAMMADKEMMMSKKQMKRKMKKGSK